MHTKEIGLSNAYISATYAFRVCWYLAHQGGWEKIASQVRWGLPRSLQPEQQWEERGMVGKDTTFQAEGVTHVKVWKGWKYVESKVPAVGVGQGVDKKADGQRMRVENTELAPWTFYFANSTVGPVKMLSGGVSSYSPKKNNLHPRGHRGETWLEGHKTPARRKVGCCWSCPGVRTVSAVPGRAGDGTWEQFWAIKKQRQQSAGHLQAPLCPDSI